MNSREDAEDLAQDIVLQVLSVIHTGKQIENFNAFAWSVSNRTFFKRLCNKKDVVYLLNSLYCSSEIDENCFPQFFENLLAFLESHKELLTSHRFNRAGFTWERLLWIYLHFFTQTALGIFNLNICKIVPYWDIPDRPNDGKWIAPGFEGDVAFSKDATTQEIDMPIHVWNGPVHKSGYEFAQGFFHY